MLDQAALNWRARPAVARPLRYARRLVEMTPREVASRVLPPPALEPPPDLRPDALRPPRFLFDAAEARAILARWAGARPRQAEALVALARRGLERWEIFGAPVDLHPGWLDWHRGDTRWVWELNRHQFLFVFARAFLLTGDESFAERAAALLEDWWRQNPFACGVNWSSALEVAMRSISWLWTLPLLAGWRGWQPETEARWLTSLSEHYWYLMRRLSLYIDRTNHLIGEAAALWMLAVAMPDLPDAARQERRALEILAAEIDRQVAPDGVGLEQATGYQQFVLDFCVQVMALAQRAGRTLRPVIAERAAAMTGFLAALAGESGELPAIGDSDDARGFPFPELACDAAPFSAADLAFWLDLPAPSRFSNLRVANLLPGYCLFQSRDAGRDMALLFDAGAQGLWPNAAHGHADALSINVRLNGRWILGDPGTGLYAASPDVRNRLRGTAAHNTITVDHLDQAETLDTFKWLEPADAALIGSFSNDRYDLACAKHDGYRRLRQPVTHHRAVLFLHPPAPDAGWLIVDRLKGEGCHHCALRFHFPPGTRLERESDCRFVARDPETGAALRLCFSEAAVEQRDLWSRRFGQWAEAPVLAIEREAEMPASWSTFLAPR